MLCCVCLLESTNIMNIFDELGEQLNVAEIISEHFWFKPQSNEMQTSQICTACWNKIEDFHTFYKTVEKAHHEFQQNKDTVVKEEDRTYVSAIKEEKLEDEKLIENLLQLEVELVENLKKTEDTTDQKNPLWSDQNDSAANNDESDSTDSSNDEDDEVDYNEKLSKRRKTGKSKNCQKKQKAIRLDPVLSEELIKKHITMSCYVCDIVCNTFADIKIHFKDHHPDMKPYIMCCNRQFDKNCNIAQHAARHDDPDCFRCNECNKSFTTTKGLRVHNIEFHGPEGEKLHTCDYCPRKFQRKNLLELHRKSHIPEEQWNFICTQCTTRTAKFASQYLLNIHVSMFHNRKIHICHVCSKEIKDKKAFEKHVRLHFEESGPRVKCPVESCPRWLKDEENVKYHVQRYHKNYKWSECRKTLESRKQEEKQSFGENDDNLMQVEHIECEDNKNSDKFKNPLENYQSDIDCDDGGDDSDFDCNKYDEEYEHSESSANDNEEKVVAASKVKSKKVKKPTKRKRVTKKTDTNLDSTKKPRVSHSLDPKVSDEMIKKHIKMLCDLCVFVGESFPDLREHFKNHHPDVRPYVMCCNRKFDRLYVVSQHAARHENPDCFKCNECNKSFTTPYGLRTHTIEHHAPEEDKMHTCEYCPRKFQRKNVLEQHRSTHIPKEQWAFHCDKCTTRVNIFASQYLLNIHNSMFHRKEANVCHVCAKEIKDKKAFEKHVRYHFEDSGPRLKCPLPDCNRWLKDEDNLKTHMQLHNLSGKTYICPECNKECPNRRALAAHRRFVHSKEVFRCDVCEKTFKKALGLKEHMAQHTGESLYNCPFCPRTFNSNANMHSHKKKQHPLEWEELRRQKLGPLAC